MYVAWKYARGWLVMSLELAVRRQTGHRQGLRRGRCPVTAAVHAVRRSDLVSESELLLSELDRQLMMEQFRANSGLRVLKTSRTFIVMKSPAVFRQDTKNFIYRRAANPHRRTQLLP